MSKDQDVVIVYCQATGAGVGLTTQMRVTRSQWESREAETIRVFATSVAEDIRAIFKEEE